jgi:hypothetical protein
VVGLKGSGDNNNPKPNLPTEPYFQIIIAKVFLQTFLLIIIWLYFLMQL